MALREKDKKVLLLGAGYVSAPVVDYLTRDPHISVTVGKSCWFSLAAVKSFSARRILTSNKPVLASRACKIVNPLFESKLSLADKTNSKREGQANKKHLNALLASFDVGLYEMAFNSRILNRL